MRHQRMVSVLGAFALGVTGLTATTGAAAAPTEANAESATTAEGSSTASSPRSCGRGRPENPEVFVAPFL